MNTLNHDKCGNIAMIPSHLSSLKIRLFLWQKCCWNTVRKKITASDMVGLSQTELVINDPINPLYNFMVGPGFK